jgi:hypothetical protein
MIKMILTQVRAVRVARKHPDIRRFADQQIFNGGCLRKVKWPVRTSAFRQLCALRAQAAAQRAGGAPRAGCVPCVGARATVTSGSCQRLGLHI